MTSRSASGTTTVSLPYVLDDPNRNDFERCATDYFSRAGADIEKVYQIELSFYPAGWYSDWLLDGIWLERIHSLDSVTDGAWYPYCGWLIYSNIYILPRQP